MHGKMKSQWTINTFVAESVTHKNVEALASKLMDPDQSKSI